MNKNDKKQSKSGIIFAIIFILIGIVGNLDFGGGSSGAASVIVFVFVTIFVVLFLVAVYKGKKPAAKSKMTVERPTVKDPQPSVRTAAPERKYYDSDCEKQSSEHEHNRRLEQLDTFLKDGIISREEYNILKAKYMR